MSFTPLSVRNASRLARRRRFRYRVLHGHAAQGLPARVKPFLMDAVWWPVWKRAIYPGWLRWYRWHCDSRCWRVGSYQPGDVAHWRGVRLVCCTTHYVGDQADHPWDPGWGWPRPRAAALWEPARRRDRLLLEVYGDPRSRQEASDAGA